MSQFISHYSCIEGYPVSTTQVAFEFRKKQIVNFGSPSWRVSKKMLREKWSLKSDPQQLIRWRAVIQANARKADAIRRRNLESALMVRNDSLESEFRLLVNRWNAETFYLSSLTKIYAHPAYQRIIAMGTDGLPLVLSELRKHNGNWFYALKFMAGKDVAAGINDFEDAKAAWLEWGYEQNYI